MVTQSFRGLEPVVLASDAFPTAEVFSGYAFAGTDLILGDSGLRLHRQQHGEAFSHHEDGCYFLASPTAQGLKIGTDFKGNCKIFFYRSEQHWAVSNSFAELIRTVKSKQWPTTIQPHVVDTWGIPGRFWDQCWSYGTAVKEVSLLPRWGLLEVTPNGLTETEPALHGNEEDYDAYLHELSEYLNTWIGRIGTILGDDSLRVQLELTGGKDSRGVLALFLAARQYFGLDLTDRVNVMSSRSRGKEADLKVAQDLASAYGLPLNNGGFAQGQATYLSANEQVDWWAAFALGSYRPIYLVNPRRYLSTIPFGGQGGEGTRQQYEPFNTMQELLEHNAKHFASEDRFDAVIADVEATVRRIRGWTPRVPELLAHYQEFRDRFHSGLHPQTRPRFIPLTGRHLHSAARSLPEPLLLQAQALRDLTAQSAPGLLQRPYDDRAKAPSAFNLEHLAPPLPLAPKAGKVYGEARQASRPDRADTSAWSLVLDWLSEAVARVPRELVTEDAVSLAKKRALETPDTPGASRAGPSRPIHHVLLADFLTHGAA